MENPLRTKLPQNRQTQGSDPQAGIWKIRSGVIELQKTRIMGVLNLTPDSFSDGGKFLEPRQALSHAMKLVEDGADILDLGAESTRPGALPVDEKEELARLLPVLREIRSRTSLPISIDTTKAEVAAVCLAEGADIINDVSALQDSGTDMIRHVREAGAGLILMHRRGNPATMQSLASYANVVTETLAELKQSVEEALAGGINSLQLAVDPGLGFAKNAEQNLELLAGIEVFHHLGRPVVLGPSKKSFIGKATGREAHERLFGTAAVVAHAVLNQIQIIRVHDVAAMKDVITMIEAIQGVCHVRS